MSNTHIKTIDDGTAYYREKGAKVRYQGQIQIYQDWVRIGTVQATWIPREGVEQIHEQ